MVAKDTSMEEYFLNGGEEKVLFRGKYKLAGGFDVDIANDSVYWCSADGKIYRFNSDENSVINSEAGNPSHLLVNWLTRKLYWVNDNKKIEYSDLDGNNKHTLVESNHKLLAMALDPRSSYIYWCTDNDEPTGAVIERMKLNGTNREVIISGNLQRPTSIIVDYASNKLYWADSNHKKIESSDLRGVGRSTVCQINSRQAYIALYGDTLYYTDPSGIRRCTTDGNDLGRFITASNIRGIIIRHQSKQAGACKL